MKRDEPDDPNEFQAEDPLGSFLRRLKDSW